MPAEHSWFHDEHCEHGSIDSTCLKEGVGAPGCHIRKRLVQPFLLAQGCARAPHCAGCPDCKCGDADNNGIWNISDAVKLIGYIFGGGPPPGGCDPCQEW